MHSGLIFMLETANTYRLLANFMLKCAFFDQKCAFWTMKNKAYYLTKARFCDRMLKKYLAYVRIRMRHFYSSPKPQHRRRGWIWFFCDVKWDKNVTKSAYERQFYIPPGASIMQ